MFKYTPLYANGKEPVIEEQDVYRIEIPYVPTLQSTDAEGGQKSGPESGPEKNNKTSDLHCTGDEGRTTAKPNPWISHVRLRKNKPASNCYRQACNKLYLET